jgi:hypothetical protein
LLSSNRHEIVRTQSCDGGDRAGRLRSAIVDYARGHPHASDTMSGILDWWLPADLRGTPAETAAVLDDLVAEGVLRGTRLVDGTTLYSVPPDTPTRDDAGGPERGRCINR